MANPEHVKVVRKGGPAIEEWRLVHPNKHLDLSSARLPSMDLSGVKLIGDNLSWANLMFAQLSGADLSRANLYRVDLTGAKLNKAKFAGANLNGANLFQARLPDADLSEANIPQAYLVVADLSRANLTKARLWLSDLAGANLTETNLCGTVFHLASLFDANLIGANLIGADLTSAIITGAKLTSADFTRALMGHTIIGNCDLTQVEGLSTIIHESPSIISVNTLISTFRSAGNRLTPELEIFFLAAGVPRNLLDMLPKIVAETKYYTAFVGYGQPDAKFAEKLVRDLRRSGASCWLYSLDATPGERTWREISQARRAAEKMIVLCSVKSLIRDGLLKEVEEQIDEDPDKMVPVSLDNLWKENGFLVMRAGRNLKPFLKEINYADFSDASLYKDSLNRLLEALERKRLRASKPSKSH